jgi:hypothetical protein
MESYYIERNEQGNELSRTPRGKGKPRVNFEREDGGNYVRVVKEGEELYSSRGNGPFFYMTLDSDTEQVLKKEPKGRGRTRAGFVKDADGNWYKYVSAEEEQTEQTEQTEQEPVNVH